MKGLIALMRREFSLAFGGGGGPLLALTFYACLVALLPLAAGRNPSQLGLLGPDIAWLALALASLLSLERLFERDYEDGALELLAMGPVPLEAVSLVKALAQFAAINGPLAIAARRRHAEELFLQHTYGLLRGVDAQMLHANAGWAIHCGVNECSCASQSE